MRNEDGYELWLRYRKVDDSIRIAQYCEAIQHVAILGESETVEVIRSEIAGAIPSLLGKPIPISSQEISPNTLIIGSMDQLEASGISVLQGGFEKLGNDGFMIQSLSEDNQSRILISAKTETAVLTGTFHFLRLLQTQQDIRELNYIDAPKIDHRILAHWDNIDGSIERGYAGKFPLPKG